MLFVTAFVLYRVLLATSSAAQQRRAGLIMGGSMLVITVVHCYLNDTFLHGCIFAAMIVVIGLKTMARIQGVKDSKTRATLWILARFGIGMFYQLGQDLCIVLRTSRVCCGKFPIMAY